MVNLRLFIHSFVAASIVLFMRYLAVLPMYYSNFSWYDTLVKSSLNPPKWVFGIVWSSIYFLLFCSIAIILYRYSWRSIKGLAALFMAHATFHVLWGYLFWIQQNLLLSFIDIELAWLSLIALVIATYQYSRLAAALFLPYLCWLGYASILAFRLYQLN